MDGPPELPCRPAVEPADDVAVPRRPERAQLATAINELAAAAAELAAAHAPATRLAAVIAEASRLEGELAELQVADEQRLGLWLAQSNSDPRPGPSPATVAAETRLTARAGDAAAARAALPAAEQAFQRCAANVRELQRRRDDAICGAAIDAARGFAAVYRAALTAAMEQEAVLLGLRDELLRWGNRADAPHGAMDAAARIGQLIAEIKRAAAVRRHPQAAQKLLAALVDDPDAGL
jgi:hypothetical protein